MKIMVLYNDTAGKSDAKDTAESFKNYLEEHDPKSEAVLQPSNPDIEPETIQKMRKNIKSIRLQSLVETVQSIMRCKHLWIS